MSAANIISSLPISPSITTAYSANANRIRVSPTGLIRHETVETAIPESLFTIPYEGYYSYSIQISTALLNGVVAGDLFTFYAQLADGNDINGTSTMLAIVPNVLNNNFYINISGIITRKLNVGEIIRFLHVDTGVYTYTGAFTVAYCFLGNNLM